MQHPDQDSGENPLPPGHDIASLGPGDSSDSGSDIRGAHGRQGEITLDLDRGTYEDPPAPGSAANDVISDSDTDAAGTGERGVGPGDNDVEAGQDIDIDRIDSPEAVHRWPEQDSAPEG